MNTLFREKKHCSKVREWLKASFSRLGIFIQVNAVGNVSRKTKTNLNVPSEPNKLQNGTKYCKTRKRNARQKEFLDHCFLFLAFRCRVDATYGIFLEKIGIHTITEFFAAWRKKWKRNSLKWFWFSLLNEFLFFFQSNPYGLKDSGPTSDMSWTTAGLQPTTGYYSPYDPTLAAYG